MTDWLTSWGEVVPETMRDHVNAHEGMGALKGLEKASDAEFQDMWLQMMVEHHTGAVQMATTEQQDGQDKSAVDLAGQIIESQTKEIQRMNELLS